MSVQFITFMNSAATVVLTGVEKTYNGLNQACGAASEKISEASKKTASYVSENKTKLLTFLATAVFVYFNPLLSLCLAAVSAKVYHTYRERMNPVPVRAPTEVAAPMPAPIAI